MADFLTKKERSGRMSLVKGRGNRSTELHFARALFELGIHGWRRGARLPGSPDFTFVHERIVVFVDGCFWHGCPQHYTKPQTNAGFWATKRRDNIARDRRVDSELRRRGWRVMRIWEHELRSTQLPLLKKRLRRRFAHTIHSDSRRNPQAPRGP